MRPRTATSAAILWATLPARVAGSNYRDWNGWDWGTSSHSKECRPVVTPLVRGGACDRHRLARTALPVTGR